MTCQSAREWLSDFLDEALEPDRRVEVETHLATCAECRVELERLRATVSALRGLERPRAPAGFVDRVVQRVHPAPWYRRAAAWLFLPLSVKLPAEAAALVVVAGLAVLVWERTPELRHAARVETPTPSSSSNAPVEPTLPAPAPPPPAPGSAPQPSKAPRARSQAPRPSSPAPAEPEARGASRENIVSAPPAQEAKPDREPPAARPPVAAESSESKSARSQARARSAPQAVRRALAPAPPPSDLAGRLIVKDRDAASAGVADLLSRLGGRETGRWPELSDIVVEVQVPASRYDEFIRGLESLGSWRAAGRPNVFPTEPPQIRMTIRLVL